MLEHGRKMLGLAVAGLMLAGAVVYFVRDPPAPAAQRSTEERAAEIARHREAQRAAVLAPATRAESTAAARDKAPPTATRAAPSAVVAAPYWTDFRGPQRDGHYRERPIRTSWSSGGLKPLWKQPVG